MFDQGKTIEIHFNSNQGAKIKEKSRDSDRFPFQSRFSFLLSSYHSCLPLCQVCHLKGPTKVRSLSFGTDSQPSLSKVVYTSPASARLQPAGRSSATLRSGFNHDNKQYVAPPTQHQRAQHRPSPSRADGSGCCILPVPGPRQPASDPTGCSRCRPSASLCRGTVRVGSSSHFLPPPQPTLSRAAQCSGGTDAMTQNCGATPEDAGRNNSAAEWGFTGKAAAPAAGRGGGSCGSCDTGSAISRAADGEIWSRHVRQRNRRPRGPS